MLVKIGHRPIKNIKEGDLRVSKNKVKTLKRGEYILWGEGLFPIKQNSTNEET